jgi:hypothetical protein
MGGDGGDGGDGDDGGLAVAAEEMLHIFEPQVTISRVSCRRDIRACRDNLTRSLRLTLGGERRALPNDAL